MRARNVYIINIIVLQCRRGQPVVTVDARFILFLLIPLSREVTQRRAELVLGWVTVHEFGSVHTISVFNRPPRSTQPGHPSRVGDMSTGDSDKHCRGRNDEFCVTLDPITRTAGIMSYRLKELADVGSCVSR